MSYQVYIEYKGGSRSHRLKINTRNTVEKHINEILADSETLHMAERIIMKYGRRIILNASTTLPPSEIRKKIKWPVGGAPRKVPNPVTATFYIPKKVREWLVEHGDGKMNEGLRKLALESGVDELIKAYDMSK
jgi:hypothetical protein